MSMVFAHSSAAVRAGQAPPQQAKSSNESTRKQRLWPHAVPRYAATAPHRAGVPGVRRKSAHPTRAPADFAHDTFQRMFILMPGRRKL